MTSNLPDAEHYNYFRDYDPSIGRYIESDPAGIQAGTNTYAYVGADPLGFVDDYGMRRRGFDGREFPPEPGERRCAAGDAGCAGGFQPGRPMTCMENCMLGVFGKIAASSVGRNLLVSLATRSGSAAVATSVGAVNAVWTPVALSIGPSFLMFTFDQCDKKCNGTCSPNTTFFFAP